MTLQLLHSEFPYIQYEENVIFFFISVVMANEWEEAFFIAMELRICVVIFYAIDENKTVKKGT
jgi:hypothetical protein